MTGLLALDLDGTVLLPDGQPVPGIHEEVQAWCELGWRVAVITARYRKPAVIETLGADAYTRNYGAQVFAGGQELVRLTLPPAMVQVALEAAPPDARLMALTVEEGFVATPRRATDRPLHEWTHGQDFVKILLEHPDEQAVKRTCAAWEALPGTAVIWERPTACMLVAAGADKGSALKRIAAYYGLPLERTVAAGDGFSDAAMLAVTGRFLIVGRNPALRGGYAFAEHPEDVPAQLALLRHEEQGRLLQKLHQTGQKV